VDSDSLRDETGDVVDLAQSIRTTGVLHPIHVERHGHGTWQVIAGQRRLAAARAAGHRDIPCVVHRGLDDRARVMLMLAENVQRADLSPIEEAEGYQRLHAVGMTQVEIARQVGRHQSHISKRLALLDLPGEDQAAIHRGDIPVWGAHPRKRITAFLAADGAEPIDSSTLGATLRDRLLAAAEAGDTYAADVLERALVQGCHQLAKYALRREAMAPFVDDDGVSVTKSLLVSSVVHDPETGAWLGRVLTTLPQMPADAIKDWIRRQHREVKARNQTIRLAHRLLAVMAQHPRAKTPADAARMHGTSIDELLNPDEVAA
jgi:ParB/RepB/Spo0J family partition protein